MLMLCYHLVRLELESQCCHIRICSFIVLKYLTKVKEIIY